MPISLPYPQMASIDAGRPVFLIVMGICLMIFTWRLASRASDWPARLMVAGSLLLGFGYSVVLPLYEAGAIPRMNSFGADQSIAIAWQAVKLVVMNFGWLTFGVGIAMHAKILPYPVPRPASVRGVQPAPVAVATP